MIEVTLQDFRCFREEQTARLAPLTLLVGDNGTGKTSFLALLRALWDVAFEERAPNFKAPPYDLGSFADIVHFRGSRGERPLTFRAGFLHENEQFNKGPKLVRFTVDFGMHGATPRPVRLRAETEEVEDEPPARRGFSPCWTGFQIPKEGALRFAVGTRRGEWDMQSKDAESPYEDLYDGLTASYSLRERRSEIPSLNYLIRSMWRLWKAGDHFPGSSGEKQPTKEDWRALVTMAQLVRPVRRGPPYAGAPSSAEPYRSYDPGPTADDPTGGDIPMYLADLSGKRPANRWGFDRCVRFWMPAPWPKCSEKSGMLQADSSSSGWKRPMRG